MIRWGRGVSIVLEVFAYVGSPNRLKNHEGLSGTVERKRVKTERYTSIWHFYRITRKIVEIVRKRFIQMLLWLIDESFGNELVKSWISSSIYINTLFEFNVSDEYFKIRSRTIWSKSDLFVQRIICERLGEIIDYEFDSGQHIVRI